MDTRYRIEQIEDSYGCVMYYITYLLVTTKFFGLIHQEHWVTVPVATDARALGLDIDIINDCFCVSTFGEVQEFIKGFPNINDYLNIKFIPKMNELIDKWVELKAEDEDKYDEILESKGFAYIN